MKKVIRLFCLIIIIGVAALMSAVVYGFYSIPDEMYSLSNQKLDTGFYTCSFGVNGIYTSESVMTAGQYKLNVSLFNRIPVKSSKLTVSDRRYLVPSGEIIGLRLFTKGVMIVGTDSVDSKDGAVDPAGKAGLKKGDVIVSIGTASVNSSAQVEQLISESDGSILELEYLRDGKTLKTSISPVYSVSEKKYKTGLWIRDSAAGIGTMTFYEKNTGFFACLGHAVCDVDTGEILPLADGDIVDAQITGCVKGKSGSAGELCGSFKEDREGTLYMNDAMGVFGVLDSVPDDGSALPVASTDEIREGSAYIIATVEGESKCCYSIEIEKLSPGDKDGKNMIIKITDSLLIEKTGGIVQGMSGSPIIQNGYLVGAVTHVFVNDPTKGYGIFAETMLERAESVSPYQLAG